MQKIVTNLWFDGHVEEALEFYSSIFKSSKVKNINYYGDEGSGKKGDIMVATIEIHGQDFTLINGGPGFPHSPAMSLLINCETQEEVDELWQKLVVGGGEHGQCGWLTDRFGISWQVVPTTLEKLMSSGDEAKSQGVTKALLSMQKLDITVLEAAYNDE